MILGKVVENLKTELREEVADLKQHEQEMEEAYEAKVKALEENMAKKTDLQDSMDRLSFDFIKLPYCCASTTNVTDNIQYQAMQWCSYYKTWLKMKLPLLVVIYF